MANWWDSAPLADSGAAAQSPYADAIASIESAGSGDYRAVGPATRTGDRALGRYQIMGQNIRPWSKEVLGREVTPQEFMASPQLQDQIFNAKFGSYVDRYGPEGAARAWFAGEKGMNDPNRRDVLGTSVAQYGQRFAQAAGVQPQQPMAFAPERQPMSLLPQEITNPQSAAPTEVSAQSRQPAEDNSWWQSAPMAEPTFNERFGGDIPQPQNAGALQADMQRAAGQRYQPKLSDAVTDIPNEVGAAFTEGLNNVKGIADRGGQGPIEGLLTTGRAVMGVPQMLLSPLTGAARSLIGHPMAQAEHAVGTIIAPEIASRDNQRAMYDQAKKDADFALSALATRGVPAVAPRPVAAPSAAPLSEGQQVVQAAGRVADATGVPVAVPRAVASDSMATQRVGQGIRNIPVVGDAIPKATYQLADDLGGAVRNVASSYGEGSGPNVANRIGNTVQSAADAETAAATNLARRSDEALQAAHQADTDAAYAAITQREARSLEQARQAVGDLSPQDMGQTLITRLRAGEEQARATKDRLYQIAGNSDAAINSDAVGGLRARVAQSLENDGRVIDGVLTPASSRMMDELQRLSTLNIENRAVGARAPIPAGEQPVRAAVSMQGIEQTRKRLNAMAQAASNDADRSAARRIIREFDNWLSDAFDNSLFSGSDEALQAFRQARQANTEWRQRFGFNARDDADRIINRVVTGEVTPQEVSNWLVGASQVGSKGLSSRLLTRIAEATGNDQQALQAIRGGIWNRLSQATEGATPKAPEKVASSINEFLNGSGRDVAQRMFTPAQQNIMRAYADTIRGGVEARQIVEQTARATRPTAMEVGPGPMQELATSVLGRSGKPDEALFNAIDAYAKSGGRTDVATLARIIRAIPQQERGDLAGAIIRKLGVSPRTGEFSTDVFTSQWKSYTPQAKAILFGNAGPQRQALDDILTISERLKQVGSRFGNPSGTAQNVNLAATIGAGIASPLTTLAGAVGGAVAARILAAPASAVSAAKWSRSYANLIALPSPQKLAAFQVASRNLANMARDLGANVTQNDFIRAIQGPVHSPADNEQPESERVIDR